MSISGDQDIKMFELWESSMSWSKVKRSDSSEPSCVSMKSDWSQDPPANFRDRGCSTNLSLMEGKRSASPEPSCVSMKSDWSQDPPANFSDRDCSTELRVLRDKSKITYRNHVESIFKVCVCVCVCV
ncbi:hypothetical protein PGIGA_G00220910 [Pangasianodon gigas]|uniref:Uncharacterized protein n=1 Tax=Pangasianodon gigas TaxID=30993 RepID=A0ACC5WJ71_PANGG|nr:hypothetical protein [Pangasianodon gigas]